MYGGGGDVKGGGMDWGRIRRDGGGSRRREERGNCPLDVK